MIGLHQHLTNKNSVYVYTAMAGVMCFARIKAHVEDTIS